MILGGAGYDTLINNTTELSAVKQYLKISHAAKHEGLDTVDKILQSLLTSGSEMTAAAVLALIASGQQIPSPLDMDIDPPDLNEFDDLLSDKDAERLVKISAIGCQLALKRDQ